MDSTDRKPLDSDARTLPAFYYTDPDVYRAEIDRFFRGMWVCAGREEQVAAAGAYFLRELDDESVIIVRDREGTLRAFLNVCRHRGTRICTESEGSFSGVIQCPYHAWTYDLAGRLIGSPHMDGSPGFRKDDYPLYEVGASVWDGHVFIHLRPGADSLETQLGDLVTKFRPWRMGQLRRASRIVYDVAANWKLIVQNYSECLHCPTLHPALQGLSHYLSGVNDDPHPCYLGGRSDLREGVETLSMDGKRRGSFLDGLAPEDRRRVYYYAVLPNLLLSLHPDYLMTHTLWPRSSGRTEIICEWHFPANELTRPGFDPGDVVAFWDMTNRQDWRITELAQLGLKSRRYTPGPYSNREDLLYAFDQIVARNPPAPARGTPPAAELP
jgi:Rieske 2Fe-2S family protein